MPWRGPTATIRRVGSSRRSGPGQRSGAQPPVVIRGRRAADVRSGEWADRFLVALRGGDARAAGSVAEEALVGGLDGAAVHARVIEPAMRGIGELWENNAISVSEEHLATAISHGVAARMFPRLLTTEPGSRERVMLAAVQGEHHVLGLRLVGDVLEGAGYDVLYLGADVPIPALIDACRRHEPAVLGLTVSMWINVPTMILEIEELVKLEHPPRVIVGGRAVVHLAEKGLRVPAIGHCDEVLDVVGDLMSRPPSRDLVDPELVSRVPSTVRAGVVGTEGIGTIPAAFSATSLEAADAARESARHAFAMEQLAFRDGLTGLFNRRAFDDQLLEMSAQDSAESAMLMIDVDRFKSINDGYGHEAGDEMLITVARSILSASRSNDIAARFGGDEFVVLLPGTREAEATEIAERIRAAVEAASSDPVVTVSIGVAVFSENNRLTSQAADRALYRAKESGRNVVARCED